MKTGVPPLYLGLFLLFFGSTLIAQPINDECGMAIPIPLAASRISCQQTAGNTLDATGSQAPRSICSTSWFGDDIWYSLTTGSSFEKEAIVIRCFFGGEAGDIPAVGMAVYPSCDMDAQAIACFTTAEESNHSMTLFTNELASNTTYYIRLWSSLSGNDHSGSFRICAYQDNASLPNPIFWEETFANGLGDWEVNFNNEFMDTSSWQYTSEASQGRFGQHELLSPTAGDGWMLFDADYYFAQKDTSNIPFSPPWPVWRGELISPVIDCSMEENIKLQFWQYARLLFGETSVSYSLDGGSSWSPPINVNPDLPANEGSPISGMKVIHLPALDGEDNVRIKFIFQSDFYVWLIDDVRLMGKVPNSRDLRMLSSTYPDNIQTPVSQVAPIHFASFPFTPESGAFTNVKLNLEIEDRTGSTPIFTTQIQFDTFLNPDFNELIFPQAFTPKEQLVTTYNARYTITADGINFDPDVHQFEYPFYITDSTYAKETEPSRNLRPADPLWAPQAPHSYALGNSFYVQRQIDPGSGQQLYANSVSFQMTNLDEHRGKDLLIYLYEWEDQNGDQLAQLDPSNNEMNLIGFHVYTIPQNVSKNELKRVITVPLWEFPYGSYPFPPALREGKTYLVTVEYNTDRDNENVLFEASEEYNYSTTIELYKRLNQPRYTHALKIGVEEYYRMVPTADLSTTNFGHDVVPFIRLNVRPLEQTTSTIEKLPEDNRVQLFPNPVQDQLFVDLELNTKTSVLQMSILNVEGKVMMLRQFKNVQKQRIPLDVSQLPNGIYWLQVDSQQGQRSNKFVIQR